MTKNTAYEVADALPPDTPATRAAAELLRTQAEEIERLKQELALLKPDARCDAGCMLLCSGEAKHKLEQYEGLLLWALYHHQGGCSHIGQPIRRALDIGEYDDLTAEQIAAARRAAGKSEADGVEPPRPGSDARQQQEVVIDYTNWRGLRALRRIHPRQLRWGHSKFHPEPQFLLRAWDVEKLEMREFALKDIHTWSAAGAPSDAAAGQAESKTADTSVDTRQSSGAWTDDDLRALWREKGGRFHGPHIETGTMPEAQLLPMLRELMTGQKAGAGGSSTLP